MFRIFMLCGLLIASGLASAETLTYNRVDFQVEAAREVANDLLTATMTVDVQDKQPGRVAQQLNATLNAALKEAAAFKSVKTRSGNQQTFPVYGRDNQVDAWRGHGEIRIESQDFKSAGELIMKLQSSMQLGGVQFSISPAAREQLEEALVSEAIKAFQSRAEAIRSAVGAKSYKTVHFSINNGMSPYQPMPMMREAKFSASMAAPEFAGGDSRMTMQVSGTIELR